jgi:hypothetical protein
MNIRRSVLAAAGLAAAAFAAGCAGAGPIISQRTKPGGAGRWAEELATPAATQWSTQAALCRITGAGVGADGWLPDIGGYWLLTFWSPDEPGVLEITVDSDGGTQSRPAPASPHRGRTLPADWMDTPHVWAATRAHQSGEVLSTFDAELAFDAEPERYPGQPVWRIRFYLQDATSETHVVTPQGVWLASY